MKFMLKRMEYEKKMLRVMCCLIDDVPTIADDRCAVAMVSTSHTAPDPDSTQLHST